MKIAAINLLPNGSPATIMRGILAVAEKNIEAETISFYGNWKRCALEYKGSIRFGYRIENYVSAIMAKCTGIHGVGSVMGTMSLIRKLKKFNPDIIHLHNLHLWCVNIPLLFNYIKKNDIKVVWTLHDCWAFTGRCPYFLVENCQKWKHTIDILPSINFRPFHLTRHCTWMRKWEQNWCKRAGVWPN